MNWYKIVLSQEQVSRGELNALEKEFTEVFLMANTPPGLSLFNVYGETDPPITHFLPPSAKEYCPEFLEKFPTEECLPPERSVIAVRIGNETDLDLLFPE